MMYQLRRSANETLDLVASEEDVVFDTVAVAQPRKQVLCVWPSALAQQEALDCLGEDASLGTAGLQKAMKRSTREGARAKLQWVVRKMKGTGTVAPILRQELEDALALVEREGLFKDPENYTLLRTCFSGPGCLPDKAPGLQVKCFLGCGKSFAARDYAAHEILECPNRKILKTGIMKIPNIGAAPSFVGLEQSVRAEELEVHGQIKEALQKALLTWNVKKIRAAIDNCVPKGHKRHESFKEAKFRGVKGTELPKHVLSAAERYLQKLEEKVILVQPVIKRGNVSIDFDACSVVISKTIQFASRKPPDASAELQPDSLKESDEIITDLATVLSAFQTKMIVEGHTGSTDPPGYWQALADNRAKLLVGLLEKKGVPKGVAIPRGSPGGGAKVLVYPAPS